MKTLAGVGDATIEEVEVQVVKLTVPEKLFLLARLMLVVVEEPEPITKEAELALTLKSDPVVWTNSRAFGSVGS
jgi:hypothetical protein